MVPVDTIERPPALQQPVWMVEYQSVGGGPAEGGTVPIPLSPVRHDAVDPRGGFWTGRTDALHFVHLSGEGDTLRRIERIGSPRPVTPEERHRAIEDLTEQFGEALHADPNDMPEHLPFWSGFFADPEGRLWVERYTPAGTGTVGPRVWEVYDPEGTYLGALDLPLRSDPTPAIRNGRLVGVVQDELGVDYVVAFEVRVREN
jgi:hypothetical protein